MHLFGRARRDDAATLEDLETVLMQDSAGAYVPPSDPQQHEAPPNAPVPGLPSVPALRASGGRSQPSASVCAARAPPGLVASSLPPPGLARPTRTAVLSVQCVRCGVALVAPLGAPSLQCGRCGQVMVPSGTSGGAGSDGEHYRQCGRCGTVLKQPPGADTAACGSCNALVQFTQPARAPLQQQPVPEGLPADAFPSPPPQAAHLSPPPPQQQRFITCVHCSATLHCPADHGVVMCGACHGLVPL